MDSRFSLHALVLVSLLGLLPAATTAATADGTQFLQFSLTAQDDCEEDMLDASVRKRLDSYAAAAGSSAATKVVDGGTLLAKIDANGETGKKSAATQPAEVLPVWSIQATDKTLNAALARWAASAGWQLVWELTVDYAVDTQTSIPGTFEDAVAAVIKSMDSAEMPMQAIFYKGNRVLRIVAKGAKS
jgi:hypothetical protein